ncbi:hypothetical protein WJX73_000502 [Symbiochloris irregularis]|uniref:Dephospho-CoA kinase n=1 Tax=Symbiochloris irregularis TaxID=706552 RepID=A0AAW1Q272_9CHLO
MIMLGLTGGIGMGKSTVADMFARQGVPVFDADKVVQQLYGPGGGAVPEIERAFPGTTGPSGVSRERLSRAVIGNQDAMQRLEMIVHPMVQQHRQQFLEQNDRQRHRLVVLDIPLLFETGAHEHVDAIAVVSCSPDVQRSRVLARTNMEPEKFEAIRARQVPDAEKRAKANYVIDTGLSLQETEARVAGLIQQLVQQNQTPM